jgi:prepilin-type processing-associated H-X9-DG protein
MDNNGYYVPAYHVPAVVSSYTGLGVPTFDHPENWSSLLKCPSVRGAEEVTNPWLLGNNYGANQSAGFANFPPYTTSWPIKKNVKDPSTRVALVDMRTQSLLRTYFDCGPQTWMLPVNFLHMRHNNGCNILWLDKHVSLETSKNALNLPWSSWIY